MQLRQPAEQRCQWGSVELVQPFPSAHLVHGQSAFAKHAQVTAHGRTADVEAGGYVTGGHHPIAKQHENVPPDRIADGESDVHGKYVTITLHIVKAFPGSWGRQDV